MRKVDSDSWKLIRWSRPGGSLERAGAEIVKSTPQPQDPQGRPAAIVAEDFGASPFASEDSTFPGSCRCGDGSWPARGESGAPIPGYTECARILLYNVKVEP